MALIIEDGSLVSGANSYIDDTFFLEYASARGIELPTTEVEREGLLVKSMDYLESFRSKFKGEKTSPKSQALQWPREDVYIDCEELDKNTIPVELKKAQAQAAIEVQHQELFYTSDGSNVKKEKLDNLEVEYFQGGSGGKPSLGRVDAFLDVLLEKGSRNAPLTRF